MKRLAIGPQNRLYPLLTTIVGVATAKAPNGITVAQVGTLNHASGDTPEYFPLASTAAISPAVPSWNSTNSAPEAIATIGAVQGASLL